jgi:formylglycine-generating enzyme required for sulfatase activity
LPFLKDPVPAADSTATTEAEMKSYIEKIPGTKQTFKMIPIKGGKFKMGSPDTEKGRHKDEGPQHEVEVLPFWMEEHEVTWKELEQFAFKFLRNQRKKTDKLSERERLADAMATPTSPWNIHVQSHAKVDKPGYPASGITVYTAQVYCKWLTTLTGRYYRLPTEAEWEYACRAGSTAVYSFGDDTKTIGEHAWWFGNSKGIPQKIKTKKPNAWGLYDMHGNVAEWVLEHYATDTYSHRKPDMLAAPVKPPVMNFMGPNGHIARGGHFDDVLPDLRAARRLYSSHHWYEQEPGYPRSIWWFMDAPFVGFRVVRPLHPPKTEEEAKLYEPDPEIWLYYAECNSRQ